MMKKILTLLLIAFSIPQAQEGVAFLINLVLNNRVSFSYSVSSQDGSKLRMEGTAVIDGDCYRTNGNGLEIYCDGKTKWTVDRAAKELYIEESEGTREYLEKVGALEQSFKYLKIGESSVSGTYISGDSYSFSMTSIVSSPLSGSTEGFSFDTSALGGDWVITDLR